MGEQKGHLVLPDADEKLLGELIWDTNETTQETCTQEQILQDVFRELQELRVQLFESENVLKQCISKFVEDKGLEKQLWNAVTAYSSTQFKCGQKMSMLQDHEDTLQTHEIKPPSSYQRKNYTLEEESVQLRKHMEHLQQNSISGHHKEEMYTKLQMPQHQLQDAEDQIKTLKQDLEKQQAITTQLEKEHHIVLNDLSSKSVILRHSIEAAHILIEDMQTLQKLLQETGTNIFFGFNKLQSHGSSLTDLLHICRNCLNEMGREFLASHTQSQHLQQKLDNITENKIHTCKLLEESNQLCKIMGRELEHVAEEREELISQIRDLTVDNLRLQERLSCHANLYKMEHHGLDSEIIRISNERQNLSSRLTEVEFLTKKYQEQSESEKKQTDLKRLEAAEIEKKYWIKSMEKSYLAQQLQVFQLENSTLLESQQALMAQIQELQVRLNTMAEENAVLNNQLKMNEDKIKLLENQQTFHKQEMEKMGNTILQLQTKVNTIEQDKNNLHEENSKLKVALINEQNRSAQILSKSTENSQQLSSELEISQNSLVESEKLQELYKERLKDKHKELLISNSNMEESKMELEIIKRKLIGNEQDLERSKEKLEDIEKKLEINEESLSRSKTELEKTQKQLKEIKKELELSQELLKEKIKELETSEENLSKSEKELKITQVELNKKELQLESSIESLMKSENELVQSHEKLRETESSLKHMSELEEELESALMKLEQNKNLEIYLSEMENELTVAQDRLRSNEIYVMKLERELELTHKKLNENYHIQNHIMKLQEELENSQVCITRLEKTLNSSQEKTNVITCQCLTDMRKEVPAVTTKQKCGNCETFEQDRINLMNKLERIRVQELSDLQVAELRKKLEKIEANIYYSHHEEQLMDDQVQKINMLEDKFTKAQLELKNAEQNLMIYREHIVEMDQSFEKLQQKNEETLKQLQNKIIYLKNMLATGYKALSKETMTSNEDETFDDTSSTEREMSDIQICIDDCIMLTQKICNQYKISSNAECTVDVDKCPDSRQVNDLRTANDLYSELKEYIMKRLSLELGELKAANFDAFHKSENCEEETGKSDESNGKTENDSKIDHNKVSLNRTTENYTTKYLNNDLSSKCKQCLKLINELEHGQAEQEEISNAFYNCKAELEKCQEDYRNKACELNCITEQYNMTLNDLEKYKTDFIKMQSELQCCKADYNKLLNEMTEYKRKSDKIDCELESYKRNYNKIAEDMRTCKADQNNTQHKLDCCKEECNNLTQILESTKADNKLLTNELEILLANYKKVSLELEECHTDKGKIMSELAHFREEYENKCKKYDKSNEDLRSVTRELENSKEKNHEMSQNLDKLKENYEKVTCQLECYKREHENMSKETIKTKADHKQVKEEFQCLKEQYKKESQEYVKCIAECEKKGVELDSFKAQAEISKEQDQNRMICEMKCFKEEYTKITKQLEHCNANYAKIKNKLECSQKEQENITSELAYYKENYNKVSSELQNFKVFYNKAVRELEKFKEECQSNEDDHNKMLSELQKCIRLRNDIAQELLKEKMHVEKLVKQNNDLFNKNEENCKRCHHQLLQELKNMGLQKINTEQKLNEVQKEKEILENENKEIATKLLHSAQYIAKEKELREKAENKSKELLVSVFHLEVDNEAGKNKIAEKCVCMKRKQKKLQEELDACKKSDTKLKQHFAIKSSMLGTTRCQLQKMEKRVEHLKTELKIARERILNQQCSHGELEKKLKSLQEEKRELFHQLQELKGDLRMEETMRQNLEKTSQLLLDHVSRLHPSCTTEKLLKTIDLSSPKQNIDSR